MYELTFGESGNVNWFATVAVPVRVRVGLRVSYDLCLNFLLAPSASGGGRRSWTDGLDWTVLRCAAAENT